MKKFKVIVKSYAGEDTFTVDSISEKHAKQHVRSFYETKDIEVISASQIGNSIGAGVIDL
jgi:hypothetical protein